MMDFWRKFPLMVTCYVANSGSSLKRMPPAYGKPAIVGNFCPKLSHCPENYEGRPLTVGKSVRACLLLQRGKKFVPQEVAAWQAWCSFLLSVPAASLSWCFRKGWRASVLPVHDRVKLGWETRARVSNQDNFRSKGKLANAEWWWEVPLTYLCVVCQRLSHFPIPSCRTPKAVNTWWGLRHYSV